MKTAITLDRPQLDSIFATLSLDDLTWAIKNLADRISKAKLCATAGKRDASLLVKTWIDAGVSQPTARQIVASLKNYEKGNVAFSGTAAEAIDFLEAI